MRVYTGIKGSECVSSTSISDVAAFLGGNGDSLRVIFHRHKGDVVSYKTGIACKSDLGRIKGRGRRDFGR